MLTVGFSHPELRPLYTHRHRLNTIIESTRVLVLDQGSVAEFDAPEALLGDKLSRFYSMALEAGLVQDADVGRDDQRQTMESTNETEAVGEQSTREGEE